MAPLLLNFSSQKSGCQPCFSLSLNLPSYPIYYQVQLFPSLKYSLKQDTLLPLLLLSPSSSHFHFLPRQLHWPLLVSQVWLLAAPIYSPHDGKSKNWTMMFPCLNPPIDFYYPLTKMYTAYSVLTGPEWSGPYLAQWFSHCMLISSTVPVLLTFHPLKQNKHFVTIKLYRCCSICLWHSPPHYVWPAPSYFMFYLYF